MLVFVSIARQVSMMFCGYSQYITLHFNAPRRARHRVCSTLKVLVRSNAKREDSKYTDH